MTKKIVAVYGTLKRGFGNYGVMEQANGEYIGDDYIQIKEMGDCGFPMLKLSDNSKKWLKVELFEVPISGIEGPLDMLEGYRPNSNFNLYNRVETETLNGETAYVYEITDDIKDVLENFYTHNEEENLFFNWTY